MARSRVLISVVFLVLFFYVVVAVFGFFCLFVFFSFSKEHVVRTSPFKSKE